MPVKDVESYESFLAASIRTHARISERLFRKADDASEARIDMPSGVRTVSKIGDGAADPSRDETF